MIDVEHSLTKQFWLFAGENCYPGGGFRDFVNSYDSVEEAIVEATSTVTYDPTYTCEKYDWYHIFDSTAYLMVAKR